MKNEKIYTESSIAGVYKLLSVDISKCIYQIENDLNEDIIKDADFIAPQLFEALVEGLKIKGYKEV